MVPTVYNFQCIAFLRGLTTDREFKRHEVGYKGEEKFYRYLQEFGMSHWVILRNVWFNDDSDFECDFVLLTWHGVYLFEVKNYYGKFIYENGESSSRGVPITYNPINQTRNATIHLRNLTSEFSRRIDIHGTLVFIGDHNDVEIRDDIDYIDILTTNTVYQFIHEIKLKEKAHKGHRIDMKALADYYLDLQIQNPYMSQPLTVDEMTKAKRGVFCSRCQKKVQITRSDYVKCTCGFHESKEEAIVRTACEYGVLTYDRNFKISDIRNFIDFQVSFSYLDEILSKHFTIASDSKAKSFCNTTRDITNLGNEFQFALPKMFIYS